MDGLIYYPTIELPDDEWTTRTLLYWDSAATIVPPSVISEPDKMSSFNRELVLTELVRQLPVADMDGESYRLVSIASREFVRFLQQLDTAEIARRRSAFTAGSTTVLYTAKATGEAIDELQRLAITEQGAIHDRDSVAVEKATVRDYLAVLACSFARELSATPGNRWVIGTRSEDAMTSLMESRGADDQASVRLRADAGVKQVRRVILENLLPVPASSLTAEEILKFRHDFAGQLADFRCFIEDEVSELASAPPEQMQRKIDSLERTCERRAAQAEELMKYAGIKKIRRSKLVAFVRAIPVAKTAVDIACAGIPLLMGEVEQLTGPLAFSIFYRATFRPRRPVAVSMVPTSLT